MAVLVALGILLVGCRVDVVADLTLEPDGSGRAGVRVELDPDAVAGLEAVGIDPAAEARRIGAAVAGWDVDEELAADGPPVVAFEHVADTPHELSSALRGLADGLHEADPALLVDLEVLMDPDGAVAVDGRAGLRPPARPAVTLDGDPVGPAADELAALTAEVVVPRLEITLPGPVRDHDADRVEGRTAVWELAVGDPRSVRVRSDPPAAVPPGTLAVAGVALLVLLLVASVLWRRSAAGRRALSRAE